MAPPNHNDELKIHRSPVGVRLPLLMEIRLRTEAQTKGKKISDLIRQALCEKWGGEKQGG
jgi:hypothetical protein